MLFNALDVELELKEGTQDALPLRLLLIEIRNAYVCRKRKVGSSEGIERGSCGVDEDRGVVDNKEDNFVRCQGNRSSSESRRRLLDGKTG
jgi:hypothetical protein